MGGAIPGIGTMAIYGGPARYTGLVFAEDEDGLPKGWKPLNVERGFPKGSNTVTAAMVGSMVNITTGAGTEKNFVNMNAGNMRIPNSQYWSARSRLAQNEGVAGVLLMPRTRAQGVVDDLGWSKEQLKTYLWENSKVPWSVIEGIMPPERIQEIITRQKSSKFPLAKGEPWPITAKPENIMLVVGGGAQGGHCYYMMGCFIEPPMTREIKLPKNWDSLLKKAEEDLGPVPAPM
jgi:hypothetical protein